MFQQVALASVAGRRSANAGPPARAQISEDATGARIGDRSLGATVAGPGMTELRGGTARRQGHEPPPVPPASGVVPGNRPVREDHAGAGAEHAIARADRFGEQCGVGQVRIAAQDHLLEDSQFMARPDAV
ncbi:hypothetical protein DFR74_101809 [Nocardia puris]|uniref:Uncharacterized protein n=1 Tax=Nocardia puris TaxID=208602 RepID=A0A366E397_9NOCA|nr:hypothetical protein DFR74_101809 [Nocardia puris]